MSNFHFAEEDLAQLWAEMLDEEYKNWPGAPKKHPSSARTLARRMKSLGIELTPIEFIHHIRLEAAANKLQEGKGYSVTTIARDYGFMSEAAFVKAFEKKYGMSPEEYQSSYLNPA